MESPYRKDYGEEIAAAQRRLAALDAERVSLESARALPPRESGWALVLLVVVSTLLAALPTASCAAGYQYGLRHPVPCPPR